MHHLHTPGFVWSRGVAKVVCMPSREAVALTLHEQRGFAAPPPLENNRFTPHHSSLTKIYMGFAHNTHRRQASTPSCRAFYFSLAGVGVPCFPAVLYDRDQE